MDVAEEHHELFTAVYECAGGGEWRVEAPGIDGTHSEAETLEEARAAILEKTREASSVRERVVERETETEGAVQALVRSWPYFVAECRAVLGSELHYQAMLYHCLRAYGPLPSEQLGMNVKMWITEVVSEHFQGRDKKKHEDYRGGFEPIPDVVVFRPQIDGDFRRRNYENTVRQMLMAVEIKASERHRGRLKSSEIVDDILKLDALRQEARHRGANMLPAVITVDTAPEARERMTIEAYSEAQAAAREHRVCLFYVCPSSTTVILPESL